MQIRTRYVVRAYATGTAATKSVSRRTCKKNEFMRVAEWSSRGGFFFISIF